MRISDWSSDVCPSDLRRQRFDQHRGLDRADAQTQLHFNEGQHLIPQRRLLHAFQLGQIDVRAAIARRQRGAVVEGEHRNIEKRAGQRRSEEHTSELQSLMRISYAVFCLKKKKKNEQNKKTKPDRILYEKHISEKQVHTSIN